MRTVAGHALRERAPLEVSIVVGDPRMTTQAIVKMQDRLGMRLMASPALELHRRRRREGLALELHALVTGKAQFSLRLESGFLRDKKLMTGRAMEPAHPPDVGSSLVVALGAVLYLGFHGVQRWKMTGETLKIGPHHVGFVAGRFGDLRPFDLFVEMARFADRSGEVGVRRDLFDVGSRPAPHDSGAILNILLMADVTIHVLVRTFAPRFPCGRHDMAGAAEARIVLGIIVKTVAGQAEAYDRQQQDT